MIESSRNRSILTACAVGVGLVAAGSFLCDAEEPSVDVSPFVDSSTPIPSVPQNPIPIPDRDFFEVNPVESLQDQLRGLTRPLLNHLDFMEASLEDDSLPDWVQMANCSGDSPAFFLAHPITQEWHQEEYFSKDWWQAIYMEGLSTDGESQEIGLRFIPPDSGEDVFLEITEVIDGNCTNHSDTFYALTLDTRDRDWPRTQWNPTVEQSLCASDMTQVLEQLDLLSVTERMKDLCLRATSDRP